MKRKRKNQNKFVDIFPLNFSTHSQKRTSQRGISREYIQIALNYCESFFKQGLIYHIVKDNQLPDTLNPHISEKIRNLVIVIANDSSDVVTCYKSNNAIKNIKRKTDYLLR
jgi:hypothetical protein